MSNNLNKSISLEKLLEIEINEEQHFLEAHQKRVAFYSSILSAILAATIAGAMKATNSYHYMLLLAAPVLIFAISYIARDGTFRIYQRFLEAITIRAKIEQVIGLTEPMNKINNELKYWSEESFIPPRHLKARLGRNSTEDFIDVNKNAGYHRSSRNLFITFQVVSAFIFLLLIYAVINC